jgi:hypothetical protein
MKKIVVSNTNKNLNHTLSLSLFDSSCSLSFPCVKKTISQLQQFLELCPKITKPKLFLCIILWTPKGPIPLLSS